MKKIILIIYFSIISFISLFSQSESSDCSSLISKRFDKMTGKTYIHAANKIILSNDGGKTGLSIELELTNSHDVTMNINIIQHGCVLSGADMLFLFRDGTRVKLKNAGFKNDLGMLRKTLTNMDPFKDGEAEIFDTFRSKELEAIRISTCDLPELNVEVELTKSQSVLLMKTINCLYSAE